MQDLTWYEEKAKLELDQIVRSRSDRGHDLSEMNYLGWYASCTLLLTPNRGCDGNKVFSFHRWNLEVPDP